MKREFLKEFFHIKIQSSEKVILFFSLLSLFYTFPKMKWKFIFSLFERKRCGEKTGRDKKREREDREDRGRENTEGKERERKKTKKDVTESCWYFNWSGTVVIKGFRFS